ncbi:MAG: tetratricopeptide repeat protein [Candidatus Methanoperedens sp.]
MNVHKWMIFVIIILLSLFIYPASSQTAREWVDKGTEYDISGEYEKAIEAYNKAIAINPNDKEAWLFKGLAFGELDEYDKAIEAYNKAIDIDPNYAYAWNHKGTALTELGEYNKAIESFNKAIDIDPNYAYAWITKGAAFGKLGEYDKAIEAYNKAIAIDPNDAAAWTYKGTALTELGEYEKAIESFNKAIAIDPGYGPAWYNKGNALTELGEYDKALEAYNKAIEAFDELLDFFPNTKEAKEMRELTTKKMADLTSTSPISNQDNNWIIISGIAIFIIIGIIVLQNRKNKSNNNTDYKINKWKMFCQKCGAELKEDSMFCSSCGVTLQDGIAIEDEKSGRVQGKWAEKKVNNWKILTYVIFTWLGIAIIAKILVLLYSENSADDLSMVTGGLYGFTSLFLGIIMTYRLKKKIEFIYGVALFFIAPTIIDLSFIVGLLLTLSYFWNSYIKLEKQRLGKGLHEPVNIWK